MKIFKQITTPEGGYEDRQAFIDSIELNWKPLSIKERKKLLKQTIKEFKDITTWKIKENGFEEKTGWICPRCGIADLTYAHRYVTKKGRKISRFSCYWCGLTNFENVFDPYPRCACCNELFRGKKSARYHNAVCQKAINKERLIKRKKKNPCFRQILKLMRRKQIIQLEINNLRAKLK
jgi:ribosomal protein S27AE